jgi:uncharacterized protein (TIGR03083 family)
MLDTGVYLSALAADSEAIAQLAEGRLDEPVPHCPGWTVAELLSHLGGVYRWVSLIVDAAGRRPNRSPEPAPDDRGARIGWFRDQREAVIDTLSSHDPAAPAWFFMPDTPQNIGTWRRRQALETAIHLYDAESAAARPASVAPDLAADGVDEMLVTFLPSVLDFKPVAGLEGTVHLHCTDDGLEAGGEWVVDFTGPKVEVRRDHAKADVAVRGPASDLFLWVWNRIPLDSPTLEVFGRREVAEALSGIKI